LILCDLHLFVYPLIMASNRAAEILTFIHSVPDEKHLDLSCYDISKKYFEPFREEIDGLDDWLNSFGKCEIEAYSEHGALHEMFLVMEEAGVDLLKFIEKYIPDAEFNLEAVEDIFGRLVVFTDFHDFVYDKEHEEDEED
jgi:hypothetical protein